VQQIHFPAAPATRDEPTRYHALDIDLRNLALVPALSIRFAGDFRVGIAPGFLFSTGRFHFAEDVGGAQSPADDARYDIDSGQGIGDAKFSVTLGGGIYYRRRSVEIGVAYSSRPIGGDVSGVEVAGERTSVTLPASAGGGPVTCAGGAQTSRCVFGDLTYRLPDIWTGGVTVHLAPGLELTGTLRWIWMHLHDRIDLRITGPTLEASGLPQHIVLYRGFQDVWDARLRLAYWWRERIRVGAALRLETSAVDAASVTPAAVDGFKVQPILLAEIKLSRRLSLGGGYGITFMPQVTVTSSRFDPMAATTCAQAGNDLANPACQARLDGRARPSANGTYQRTVQDFGLTLTARF
jgi:long-subunit fatty acid transport protein